MSLKLYFHPLSSFCQKVLVTLYENDTAFEPHIVDLGSEPSRSDFLKIWPIGKFPVLRDDAKDRTIPESTIIIEYLAQHYPGRTQLIPADPDLALQARFAGTAVRYVSMRDPELCSGSLQEPDGVHLKTKGYVHMWEKAAAAAGYALAAAEPAAPAKFAAAHVPLPVPRRPLGSDITGSIAKVR